MTDRVGTLARRVVQDRHFLASALETFARSEQLDDIRLAGALGCRVKDLSLLRLCRRPRSEPASFRQDIDRIASRFGVDGDVLAQVVRRSDALEALRRGTRENRELLMAARDRPSEKQGAEDSEGHRS